jgi:Recombinase
MPASTLPPSRRTRTTSSSPGALRVVTPRQARRPTLVALGLVLILAGGTIGAVLYLRGTQHSQVLAVARPMAGHVVGGGDLVALHAPLVPMMFDLYANKRMGPRNIAMWLNDEGHRSRQGRLWSHTSVLTVLRNRAYIGEVYFRGRHYKASHPQLVDRDLFDQVQALLAERGDSLAARASSSSDYLATGKLRCGRCI